MRVTYASCVQNAHYAYKICIMCIECVLCVQNIDWVYKFQHTVQKQIDASLINKRRTCASLAPNGRVYFCQTPQKQTRKIDAVVQLRSGDVFSVYFTVSIFACLFHPVSIFPVSIFSFRHVYFWISVSIFRVYFGCIYLFP